jgi:HPt (histidine-containing phosphotransfer) domain-containing protein
VDVGPAVDVAVVESLRAWFGPRRLDQLTSLFRSFDDEADAMIGAMEAHAGHDDRTAVARIAHKLLGSSATIGARSLAELCLEIEADDDPGEAADQLLAKISRLAAEQRRFSIELALLLAASDEPRRPPTTDG